MGLVAPAFLVAGAFAVWQFGPAGPVAPDAGSATQARLTDHMAQARVARTPTDPLQTTDKPLAGPQFAPAIWHSAQAVVLKVEAAASGRLAASGKRTTAAKPVVHRPRHKVAAKVAAAFSCTGSSPSGMLPANYGPIVTFLAAHGYTPMAAAGIAGNIFRESMGNPESVGTGGGGLIGWTPLPAGYVTGNVAADLKTQLTALLAYNQQWAQYIPALNAATTPTQAADVYMNDFERPGLPAAYDREGAASAVARACRISGLRACDWCYSADTGADT